MGTTESGPPERNLSEIHQLATEAAGRLCEYLGPPPSLAIVLGSGLARLADLAQQQRQVSYSTLSPDLISTVPSHPGRAVAGRLAELPLWLFAGRPHFYETGSFAPIRLFIQMIAAAGCPNLLLTNASGGIRPDLKPGDWVLLTDHINLPGLVGFGPLLGPADLPGNTRFVDLSAAYSAWLSQLLTRAAANRNLPLKHGVYSYVAGPQYETPSEIKMLARFGADVVGMSTVPEVLLARQLGLPVAALSCVANSAGGSDEVELSHSSVLSRLDQAVPALASLVAGLLQGLNVEA